MSTYILFALFFILLPISLIASIKIALWMFFGDFVDIITFALRKVNHENQMLPDDYKYLRLETSIKKALIEAYEQNKNR